MVTKKYSNMRRSALLSHTFFLTSIRLTFILCCVMGLLSCQPAHQSAEQHRRSISAADILGQPDYLAISYGGYRHTSREQQPTVEQLIEDMQLLSAMGIKVLRTYNLHYPHAENVLNAIHTLNQRDATFEMYVMLGVWIDAKNAWSSAPERYRDQNSERNAVEIEKAIALTNRYPEIIKIIAVGNEAMVHWASEYYVEPHIILGWVEYLQQQKQQGALSPHVWITSSDNFASWGGGSSDYHTPALNALIHAVDYISMHTYPMHDTHYNPEFWYMPNNDLSLSLQAQVDAAMQRALDYAKQQYDSVQRYVRKIGANKPIHIGETGWASQSNEHYGANGSRATDEYKAALYYKAIREWSKKQGISVFYFEGFDEPWKDAQNPGGSENHFGLFDVEGKAKLALWDLVDAGVFKGLTRDGHPIVKTHEGELKAIMKTVQPPPRKPEP